MALAATSFSACKGKGQGRAQDTTGGTNPDLEQATAQAKQSLAALSTQIGKMREALAGVHSRLNALPQDMPDLDAFRSKVFSVEEVFGVEDGRVKWLSGKLDAAIAAGNKDGLKEVADAIAGSIEGNKGPVIVELTHQLMWFEGRVFTHRLPTGYEVKSARAGIEERLLDLIEDAKKKVDKTAWFVFDRVAFDWGTSKVDLTQSKGQLETTVAILKAYPQVKLKIGVFTDNTGPAAANKKLSAARAEAFKNELTALGIEPSRLKAEGYGPQQPVCPANDTAECKKRNQRIAGQVTAK
jgi:outer membrane protein OmpA-like peptidoglycan-associated protein